MARLPSGYQELPYIESTGGQYINIGKQKNEFHIHIEAKIKKTKNQVLFGENSFGFFELFDSRFYASIGSWYNLSAGITNERIVVDYHRESGNQYCKINGTTKGSSSAAYTAATSNYDVFVFARNASGSLNNPASMEVYRFWMEDVSTGSKVLDFIPCRRRSDGAIGMFDIVSQSFFGNSGTGSFIAGTPVIEPTWGSGLASVTQKELLARRFAITPHYVYPPQAFQRCEYIEGTGEPYIDTRSMPYFASSDIEMRFWVMSGTTWRTAFGANDGTKAAVSFASYSGAVTQILPAFTKTGLSSSSTITFPVFDDGICSLRMNKNELLLNGEVFAEPKDSGYEVGRPLFIFRNNTNRGAPGPINMRLYHFANNDLVHIADQRNMIPGYLKTDWNGIPAGTIGMYDLCGSICPLTNTPFYTNAGTGTFTKGPDVL